MIYQNELNPKIKIIVILLIIGFILTGIPFKMIKNTISPKQVNNTINSTVITITEYVTVMVTPTPDGKKYFATEYDSGIRKLGREFSFIRYNTSGKKSTSVHANVYDYRIFDSYHWFNPTDYLYYEEFPSIQENKFVFIFTYIYMDDVIGDDTRMWLPTVDQFNLQCYDTIYKPLDFVKQVRIRELEDTYNSNDDYRIQYYGTLRMYSNTEEYRKTAGEYALETDWLKGGKSNKVDGYIVYEVPKNCYAENMTANANYFAFGDSSWALKTE